MLMRAEFIISELVKTLFLKKKIRSLINILRSHFKDLVQSKAKVEGIGEGVGTKQMEPLKIDNLL